MSPGSEALLECTRHLSEGQRCDGRAMDHLIAEIRRRFTRAQLSRPPAIPRISDLRVRRENLPDWWAAGNNVLLAPAGVKTPALHPGFFGFGPSRNAIVVMGEHAVLRHVNCGGYEPLVVVGEGVNFGESAITAYAGGTVLIGEATTATAWAHVDARNDGVVAVGADGMWASGVNVMTDDMHAIRDMATGQRINRMGGKVVIGSHVWLGMDVRVLGDAFIGEHSVVGLSSLVKNMELPANTISAGQPARVVRTGITWTREDLP